jgi:UV DNA damage endonuclease
MFDMLGYAPSFDNKINIHIGATYGDKPATIARWIDNYYRLSDACRARLVVENDDKASMYSVRDLYEMVHAVTDIPITFDYWHHTFNTGDLSEQEAFFMARDTWSKHGVTQCISLWLVTLGLSTVLLSVRITPRLADASSNFS